MFELKNKYLGINIDGCINNLEEFIHSRMFELAHKCGCKNFKNPYGYYISDCFDISKEKCIDFLKQHIFELLIGIKPREFSASVIKKIRGEKVKVWIITSRNDDFLPNNFCGKMSDVTTYYLKENNIEFDKISLNVKDKVNFCRENNIKYMVEDNPYDIAKLADNNIKVFAFNAIYNMKCSGENINRVFSWEHLYYTLHDLYKICY